MKYFLVLLCLFSNNALALINAKKITSNFPVVKIQFKNGSHICSGTFIDNYTILTAGHCVSDKKTWKGFSLDIESVTNSNGEKLDIKHIKNIPHPKYESHWYGNRSDVGIIKTSHYNFDGVFPKLASISTKVGEVGTLYACGRIDLNNKERACLEGVNNYGTFLGQIVVWGESVNKENRGHNVSVAPNDSGGCLIDKNTNQLIGVLWGAWAPLLYKTKFSAPSIITSLFNEENLKFVQRNMGKL
ncbi:S1 family peptidase [Bacteriovoracaceae bacterium]|nr:S1 family peptidase [Bacteriovoracaceae bacterium]